MTNEALQQLISGWFPNAEAVKVSEVEEHLETDDTPEEKVKPSKPINPSLLEFTEEGSEFLNI